MDHLMINSCYDTKLKGLAGNCNADLVTAITVGEIENDKIKTGNVN